MTYHRRSIVVSCVVMPANHLTGMTAFISRHQTRRASRDLRDKTTCMHSSTNTRVPQYTVTNLKWSRIPRMQLFVLAHLGRSLEACRGDPVSDGTAEMVGMDR